MGKNKEVLLIGLCACFCGSTVVAQQYTAIGLTPFTTAEVREKGKQEESNKLFSGGFCGSYDYEATGINAQGQIIGETNQNNGFRRTIFILDSTGRINLSSGLKPAARSRINDAGQFIASVVSSDSETQNAALVTRGIPQVLGAVVNQSVATDINALGQVVGTFGPYESQHAFLWNGSKMLDLGALEAGSSIARAMNATGDVVGDLNYWRGEVETHIGDVGRPSTSWQGETETHAFLYHAGVMKDLGTLGGKSSWATGINDRGDVVGSSSTSGGPIHAFLFTQGVMTDLGTLGGDTSEASGINSDGTIVGSAETPTHQMVAFVYSNGIMKELSNLVTMWDWRPFADMIPAKWQGTRASLVSVTDINNGGKILASRGTTGLCDGAGTFVLTPIASVQSPITNITTTRQRQDLCATSAADHALTGEDARIFEWTCKCQRSATAQHLTADTGRGFIRTCLRGRAADNAPIHIDPQHPLNLDIQHLYPVASKTAKEGGRCVVRVTVAANGTIRNPILETSSGHPRLDDACLEAFLGQRMLPAIEDGKPIESTILLPIVWTPDD